MRWLKRWQYRRALVAKARMLEDAAERNWNRAKVSLWRDNAERYETKAQELLARALELRLKARRAD